MSNYPNYHDDKDKRKYVEEGRRIRKEEREEQRKKEAIKQNRISSEIAKQNGANGAKWDLSKPVHVGELNKQIKEVEEKIDSILREYTDRIYNKWKGRFKCNLYISEGRSKDDRMVKLYETFANMEVNFEEYALQLEPLQTRLEELIYVKGEVETWRDNTRLDAYLDAKYDV